jgi:hypothetical protein
MAMSKEEQKAASDRILAKEPLTAEERRTFEMLTRRPEDYRVPGEVRECGVCGAKFETILATKESPEVTALQQFSDHLAFHNPSPAHWAEAHKRIQAGKESAKKEQ